MCMNNRLKALLDFWPIIQSKWNYLFLFAYNRMCKCLRIAIVFSFHPVFPVYVCICICVSSWNRIWIMLRVHRICNIFIFKTDEKFYVRVSPLPHIYAVLKIDSLRIRNESTDRVKKTHGSSRNCNTIYPGTRVGTNKKRYESQCKIIRLDFIIKLSMLF